MGGIFLHWDADGQGEPPVLPVLPTGGMHPGGLHEPHRAVDGVQEETHIPEGVSCIRKG